ncbi:extracellular solute-binding protein, trap transporter family, dctp subunit [Sphaerotilus natans subsp. natans DSM 6575]|uniref:Extracellular solute-binding protein, trap transporter family, dctp subunit n=1 Tax=Sphaerotilus natans subsp. natans DSM 6575 TaxID=1286631 RepID=A0A059KNB7_9BURK|nr:TRAP transporter substrate-binding protein [Sphaerotilus natans]KDB52704.1 extracellular solute-binding protein, trap transporter family, dctp subunit [Sphaerotilus natans subsp. natans DSM 6575]SIR86993.1 tripartite ATP-independent transporter solute receptor, DctP family [Sphaerotilus natans]
MTLNRRDSLKALGGTLGTALGLGPLARPAWAQEIVRLRLAHAGAETDSQHLAALEFAKRVKARSGGTLEVQVFPNSTLGNDNTVLAATRGGTVDLMLAGNPYFTGLVPKLNALDLPYLFSSAEQAYKVLDGAVGQQLLAELDGFSLKGLAFWEVGFRCLANSRRPVRRAEDIRGLKIRTTPNPAHLKAFQLLGANPQPMPYAEVYPALESGAIEGHENPPIIMAASKMYEVQKHLSLTRHAYTAMPLVMNKARFDKLSALQRQWLVEEAIGSARFQREYNARHEAEVIGQLRKAGMQVVDQPDNAGIAAIVREETRRLYIEKNGDAVLKAIEAVR